MKRLPLRILLLCILLCVDIFLFFAHIAWKSKLGFFDLDKEGSFKAVISGFQLLASGFLAGAISFLVFKLRATRPFMLLWAFASALFFYLALDDMMTIHERIGFVLNRWIGWHGSYESFNWLIYFFPFILAGTFVLALVARSIVRITAHARLYTYVGLCGLFLTLITEVIGGELLKNNALSAYRIAIIVEEFSLLLGESFFFVALFESARSLFFKTFTHNEKARMHHGALLPLSKPSFGKGGAFFFYWLKFFLCFGGACMAGAFLFSLALPLLSLFEYRFALTIPYEGILRLGIAAIYSLILLASLGWIVRYGGTKHIFLWILMASALVPLVGIFFVDREHRLMEEFSFIRFPTAFFLAAAGICAAIEGIRVSAQRRRAPTTIWFLLTIGFLFGALDEIFQIHEWAGGALERALHFSHITTDLITVVYGVLAFCICILFWRICRRYYYTYFFSFGVFFIGALTYAISTVLDTLDFAAHALLKKIASAAATNPEFIFREWFTLLWAPRNFFNGLEEVLEYISAVLFFGGIALLFYERGMIRIPASFQIMIRILPTRASAVSAALLLVGLAGASIGAGARMEQSNVPTQQLAGPHDGLNHADDLFYHPTWGLLIGNEGGNSVLQWNNGMLRTLPDPQKILRDTDSVTATDSTVYASSGAQGIIFEFTPQKGWRALWTRKDGLSHPEALVFGDGALYVLDESKKSIFKLEHRKKPVEWQPHHPLWRSPEGVAYDRRNKTLIVTDDQNGAVFSVVFGSSINLITQLSRAEDIALMSNENFLVSDNGSGSIVEITPKGDIRKRAQFNRAYRDVQGIASDGTSIYAVTSDGYGQSSFMPSFVFKIGL